MIIGSKIFHKDKIYNSLDWAKENINTAPDGSVFLADVHEKTKGRQNRTWIFNKDQLTVTILLKPHLLNKSEETFNIIDLKEIPLRLNQLNMAITLGILKPLRKFNIELKWANDFYFKGNKLGGILSQAVWKDNTVAGIIIGFALNVNNNVPKLNQPYYKAVSLNEIVGKKVDKDLLLNEILKSIDFFYKKWLNSEFNEIFALWKKNQDYIDRQVTVHKKDTSWITGTFIDVLENGDMQIKKESEIIQIPFHIVDNLY